MAFASLLTRRRFTAVLRPLRLLAAPALLIPLILAGGTVASAKPQDPDKDPHQNLNRKILRFNDGADKIVFHPISKAYNTILPGFVRKGVRNCFDNVYEINVFTNDFLQGKGKQGAADVGRFAVNTTAGILGLFDVANRIGLPHHEADLGLTLAVWGCGEGNYYVLPLLGPSTTRDNSVQAVQMAILVAAWPWSLIDMLSKRAEADESLKRVDALAVDRYVFLREAYRQHRHYLISNGKPAPPPLDLDTDEGDAGPKPPAAAPKRIPTAPAPQG